MSEISKMRKEYEEVESKYAAIRKKAEGQVDDARKRVDDAISDYNDIMVVLDRADAQLSLSDHDGGSSVKEPMAGNRPGRKSRRCDTKDAKIDADADMNPEHIDFSDSDDGVVVSESKVEEHEENADAADGATDDASEQDGDNSSADDDFDVLG